MYLNSKINFTKTNFLNLAMALLPLSFIAGNMIININIIIIILSTLFLINKKLLSIKLYLFDTLLISFFLLIIFIGLVNDILVLNNLF